MPPREGVPHLSPTQDKSDKNECIENTSIYRVQSNTELSVNMSANNSHTSLSSLHSVKSFASLQSVKSLVSLEELEQKEPSLEKETDTSSNENTEDKDHFFLFWN